MPSACAGSAAKLAISATTAIPCAPSSGAGSAASPITARLGHGSPPLTSSSTVSGPAASAAGVTSSQPAACRSVTT